MLRTRLWMGAVLVVLGVGMLVIDQRLAPWFPFLFFLVLALALLACFELLQLLPRSRCPHAWLCYLSVGGLLVFNWLPHLLPLAGDPWYWIATAFTGVVLAAFLVEMAVFQTPGESVTRIGLTVWIAAYLGLLPSFLAQMRWLSRPEQATLALALAVFVPKCCDVALTLQVNYLGGID